jgi:hypothetical protein
MMNYVTQYISPESTNKYVESLLDLIDSEFLPEQINVKPVENAVPQDCFGNVRKKIQLSSGNIHYGWAIWKSDVIYEAEYHAVWEDDDGVLTDVSVHELPYSKIMFVADNIDKERAVPDNFRLNHTTNPVIDEFIKICELKSKILQLADRKSNLQINISEKQYQALLDLDKWKNQILDFAKNQPNCANACHCGSQIMYNKCCEKYLINKLDNIYKYCLKN